MAINKVVFGDDTLVDLTSDTVTEEDVLNGVTFHDKSGLMKSGSLKPVLDVEVDGDSIVDQYGVANITSDNLSVIAKDLTENKTATVTDGVADFETIDGSLVKSLVVSIEPSQSGSGTPSPSNIRPITGWTQEDVTVVGKNYGQPIPYREINGITYEPLSDGALHVSGTSTGYTLSEKIFTLKAGRYYLCKGANADNGIIVLHVRTDPADVSVASVSNTTPVLFTLTEDTRIRFRASVNSGRTVDANIYPMIVSANETDFTFEPYHGKTYTIPFGQTICGGTLNLLTGELTIDRAGVDMGSLSWFITQSNTFKAGATDIKIATSAGEDSELVCSIYDNATTDHNTGASKPDDTIWRYAGSTAHVVVKDSAYTDANTFKTAVTGQTLVYPLATPTTIQLTPQKVKSLVGENHIQASTGDVLECKYSMMINGDDLEMLLN